MGREIYCEDEESVTFFFTKFLKGSGRLYIKYSGRIPTKKVRGIYAFRNYTARYEKYTIQTEFEKMGARTTFPCFDEPNFKATFTISVIAPKNRTVLSNMPVSRTIHISDTEKKVKFEKSPKMTTYTTCIIVGDFDYVQRQSFDGKVLIRVYTPIGRRTEGSMALNVATRAVEYIQKYVGVRYPLPKLDLVSVSDYSFDAMENWEIIVFVERMILAPEKSSIRQKQTIASVVCHEVTHQWFGTLVTLDWWTQTWLNEGIATFFETL